MKHHISYFYNALLEYYPLHLAWCETWSSSSTEKTNWQTQGMFKMSTTGTNTSTQACWPLVNCVINQLTAPGLSIHAADAVAAHQYHEVTVTWYLRHVQNISVNSLLAEAFISVSTYVKIIKIHQDFPDLWSKMYCHVLLWNTVYVF